MPTCGAKLWASRNLPGSPTRSSAEKRKTGHDGISVSRPGRHHSGFHKAERIALSKTLRQFGVEPTEEVLALYHKINLWHWEQLEKGKLTRDEVQVGRFAALFRELGVSADAVRCTRSYEGNLAVGHYFLPGAEEAVASLSQKYRLFLASNGTASVQAGRLTSANLYRFFETVFISQELGFNKPAKEFLTPASPVSRTLTPRRPSWWATA